MLSQILVNIPWYTLASLFMWALFYFPVGLYKNADAADQCTERGALMWLFFLVFLIWVSTFAHCVSHLLAQLMKAVTLLTLCSCWLFFFCGVLASPDQMPRFWVFLYRASPLSYYVSAVLSTGPANIKVTYMREQRVYHHQPACRSTLRRAHGEAYLDSGLVSAAFERHEQLLVLQDQGYECVSSGHSCELRHQVA